MIRLPAKVQKKHVRHASRVAFWFSIGAFLSLFLIGSLSYSAFRNIYKDKVYPGVTINNVDFGGKTEADISTYYSAENEKAADAEFVFSYEDETATVSAKEIEFGYDQNLLASQALSVGRSQNTFSNITLILEAYTRGLNLSSAYHFSEKKLYDALNPTFENINKAPIEAVFKYEDGKVTAFKPSEEGKEVDKDELTQQLISKAKLILNYTNQKVVLITIPVKTLKPNLTTDKVNKMGINELVGVGTSLFQHSIETRIYNVTLAANRLNGVLIPPNSTFSFARAIGDISAFSGYKQAYVIQNGKTVLGDGGGVCQVSTTLFRAALNAGLPIEERHAHAYRVGYYEEDSSPGIDATVYVPTVDLKFKNDTGHYILIQTILDPVELRLTFMFYGTKDGRISEVGTPVITNQSPAPPPSYQDDPTLPIGTVKQVDFAAAGANVYFTRTVTKNGKVTISDKFISNYRPWQAVFLKGTKPN